MISISWEGVKRTISSQLTTSIIIISSNNKKRRKRFIKMVYMVYTANHPVLSSPRN